MDAVDAVEALNEDTCRICSAPAEPDQPLFHPCKCSGTIRYIHQDCLTTWLSHSKKKTCDVCKYPYSFQKVYAPDMPSTLPPLLMLRQLATQIFFTILFGIRAIVVGTIWLAVVPLITVWSWRMYFSLGDNIAWWISDRSRPPASTSYTKWLSMSPFQYHIIAKAKEEAERAATSNPVQGPPPEDDISIISWFFNHPVWFSLSSDIFTGQIIASLVVLTFVAIFLLREWIAQNARPGVFEDEANGNVENDVLQVPAPRPQVPPPRRPQIDVNARLALAQRQLEAMRALDAMLEGRDEEVADFDPLRRRDVDELDRFAAQRARRRQRNATNTLGEGPLERDIKQERIRRRNFARRLHAARQSGQRRRHELGGLANPNPEPVAPEPPRQEIDHVPNAFALPPAVAPLNPRPSSRDTQTTNPFDIPPEPSSSSRSVSPHAPTPPAAFFPDVALERPTAAIPFSFTFSSRTTASTSQSDTSTVPPPSYSGPNFAGPLIPPPSSTTARVESPAAFPQPSSSISPVPTPPADNHSLPTHTSFPCFYVTT